MLIVFIFTFIHILNRRQFLNPEISKPSSENNYTGANFLTCDLLMFFAPF